MSAPRKTIALLVETSNDYARGLLHGIVAYVREHRPWSTYLAEHGRGDAPPTWLSHWDGDGIIARAENPRIAKAIRASGLPVVDLSAAYLLPKAPIVETDNAAIARLGFEHLKSGYSNSNLILSRRQRGRECTVFVAHAANRVMGFQGDGRNLRFRNSSARAIPNVYPDFTG